jgi:hypothetical protein
MGERANLLEVKFVTIFCKRTLAAGIKNGVDRPAALRQDLNFKTERN